VLSLEHRSKGGNRGYMGLIQALSLIWTIVLAATGGIMWFYIYMYIYAHIPPTHLQIGYRVCKKKKTVKMIPNVLV
jgi:hypothetical protein